MILLPSRASGLQQEQGGSAQSESVVCSDPEHGVSRVKDNPHGLCFRGGSAAISNIWMMGV